MLRGNKPLSGFELVSSDSTNIYIFEYVMFFVRILFKEKEKRVLFFSNIQSVINLSWRDVGKILEIPKSSFEKYRSGHASIPDKIFDKLVQIARIDIKERELVKLEDNFAQVKGGREAYKINKAKFDEGRLLGSKSLEKKREIEKVIFDLDITTDICELTGTFIGDGCFNCYKNNLYHVEFAGDSRYDLPYYEKRIIPIIKNIVPDINPHLYYGHNMENSLRVVLYSKKMFIFIKDFLGFSPGKKTFDVKIPDKIILAGEEYMRATIRGIFDTDGGVFLDKRKMYKTPYPRIFLQTVSKPLYDQLFTYLSKEFKIYTRFNEKRQIYIIEIYGINQIKKWMYLIGFSNERHLNKISKIASVAQR